MDGIDIGILRTLFKLHKGYWRNKNYFQQVPTKSWYLFIIVRN